MLVSRRSHDVASRSGQLRFELTAQRDPQTVQRRTDLVVERRRHDSIRLYGRGEWQNRATVLIGTGAFLNSAECRKGYLNTWFSLASLTKRACRTFHCCPAPSTQT